MLVTLASRSYDLENVDEFYRFKALIFDEVKVTWTLLGNRVKETGDGLLWLGLNSSYANSSYYIRMSPAKLRISPTYVSNITMSQNFPLSSGPRDINYHPDFLADLLELLVQLELVT